MQKSKTHNMVIAALLCAIGIVIPMFFPKIVIEPASFTLASHVPIFIAMFISPSIAAAVSLGTTLGFLVSGLPPIVVLRAFSHLLFAYVGSRYYHKHTEKLSKFSAITIWALAVSLIHGIGEFIVVTLFYFGGNVNENFYKNGFFVSVFVLVFLGTIIHSMVDFFISYFVAKPLKLIKTN